MKNFLLSLVLSSLVFSTQVFATQALDFDLNMKKLSGDAASLKEYVGKGKWTVVMLWETTCGICKQQEPEYAAFHERHKADFAEVIGVAIDGTDQLELIQNYVDQNTLPYPILLADKDNLRDAYFKATDEQFRGTPTYLLFSPEGKLVANQPGMLPASSIEFYIEEKLAGNR